MHTPKKHLLEKLPQSSCFHSTTLDPQGMGFLNKLAFRFVKIFGFDEKQKGKLAALQSHSATDYHQYVVFAGNKMFQHTTGPEELRKFPLGHRRLLRRFSSKIPTSNSPDANSTAHFRILSCE